MPARMDWTWTQELALKVITKITKVMTRPVRRLAFVQMVAATGLFTLGQTSNRSLVWKNADVFKIMGDDDDDLCCLFILYFRKILPSLTRSSGNPIVC